MGQWERPKAPTPTPASRTPQAPAQTEGLTDPGESQRPTYPAVRAQVGNAVLASSGGEARRGCCLSPPGKEGPGPRGGPVLMAGGPSPGSAKGTSHGVSEGKASPQGLREGSGCTGPSSPPGGQTRLAGVPVCDVCDGVAGGVSPTWERGQSETWGGGCHVASVDTTRRAAGMELDEGREPGPSGNGDPQQLGSA